MSFQEELHRLELLLSQNASSTSYIEEMYECLRNMEAAVARDAYKMAPYDLRQSSLLCKDLKKRINEAKNRCMPRKKFAFSKASTTHASVKSVENPIEEARGSGERTMQAVDGSAGTASAVDGNMCSVCDRNNETIHIGGGSSKTIDFPEQSGGLRALYFKRLNNCTVVLQQPVDGAVHVEKAIGCTMYIQARQLRIHESYESCFYVRLDSGPIIENSKKLHFAPFCEQANPCGEGNSGNWSDVQDFGWLKRNVRSPNWDVLPEELRQPPPEVLK